MLYDPKKPILNGNSFTVAKDSIEQLYSLNREILQSHFANRNILSQSYLDQFRQIYEDNLCTYMNGKLIESTLLPFSCTTYMNYCPTQGLQSMLTQYFEGLKGTLKNYVNYLDNGWPAINLINSNDFLNLYVIQFRFIKNAFRLFVSSLTDTTNNEYQSIIDTRMAAFIIFIIAIAIAYLLLWTPFVNNLNREIWRTKSMLTIIPIEVILKIPRI